MHRYSMGSGKMTVNHKNELVAKVHDGTLEQEVHDAVAYCQATVVKEDWLIPSGTATAFNTPKEIKAKLFGAGYSPDETKFGGVLGWLDLGDRSKPITDMDVGRMRWAAETLDETQKYGKILGDIAVRAEFPASESWTPSMLRRVDLDATIDVVCLSLYWHKPKNPDAEHPLKNLCRDLVFCAQKVGQGVDLDVERFKRRYDEEKQRAVMGQTAWRYALDLRDMVKNAESQRGGKSDAELCAAVLSKQTSLAGDWKADTCARYLSVASKISDKCKKLMMRWELSFQRAALLDTITLLRAASTAAATATDFEIIVETLFFEQVCKLRRSIAPKGRGHATDATNVMRGILLRRAFFTYLKQIFPKLADSIQSFGTWTWFHEEYGVTETGHLKQTLPDDTDDDPDEPSKDVCSSSKDPSRFVSKEKLRKLAMNVAKCKHDWAFSQLAKSQGHATSLDLSADSMRTLRAKVQEVWTDYLVEFPPEAAPKEIPSATLDQSMNNPQQGTQIRTSNQIDNEHDYKVGLAAWGKQCEDAVKESVEDFINSTIVLITCEYETGPIENRLKKIPFMNEPGRKLFLYESMLRDPLDWASVKRNKRSVWAGAKVTMELNQAGDEAGDTLAVVKNIYQTFRTERASDNLSEDIVAVTVPGRNGDAPQNEILNTAWKSLKALGNKHIGPKVGSIRVSQDDVLSQVYTRGIWNRPPEHHFVFTYQANPSDSAQRKRMRYLKDNARMGDTFFNEWPVPMFMPSQMPKVTMAEHDQIFAHDTATDEGDENGAGAAMLNDLGDKVLPFPREFHVKLFQECIHVWGIEVGVVVWTGSGQSLLAFIIERKRAVGIVKNAHQEKSVKDNLVQAVKTLGLAPDRRPPKPHELVAWEQGLKVGGAAPMPKAATGDAGGNGAPTIVPPKPQGTPSVIPMPKATGTATPAATPAAVPEAVPAAAPNGLGPTLAAFGSSTLR